MNFLYSDRETGTYMVARIRGRENCRIRTGIRAHESGFVWNE